MGNLSCREGPGAQDVCTGRQAADYLQPHPRPAATFTWEVWTLELPAVDCPPGPNGI